MGGGDRVRVGIVAADPLRALGLESILHENDALDVVVYDLPAALADADLKALLLDDHFDGEGVIATVSLLRQERPELKLIVLGEAPDYEYIQAVVGAGAHGYLLETTTEAEIRMAMEVVLDGSVWAPRKVLARLIDAGRVAGGRAAEEPVSVARMMTARERQVLELLIGGSSNREIGKSLGIDEVTVKAHLGRMLRKTQSKNRVELTLRALEERAALKKELADSSSLEATAGQKGSGNLEGSSPEVPSPQGDGQAD